MQGIPMDEVVWEIYVRTAVEVGWGEGREIGFEKGFETGMKEKTLQVAHSMLVDGFSPEVMQKHTGLGIDNIRVLI